MPTWEETKESGSLPPSGYPLHKAPDDSWEDEIENELRGIAPKVARQVDRTIRVVATTWRVYWKSSVLERRPGARFLQSSLPGEGYPPALNADN